jgi:hypothetical protein
MAMRDIIAASTWTDFLIKTFCWCPGRDSNRAHPGHQHYRDTNMLGSKIARVVKSRLRQVEDITYAVNDTRIQHLDREISTEETICQSGRRYENIDKRFREIGYLCLLYGCEV